MNADYQDFKLNKEDIICVYLPARALHGRRVCALLKRDHTGYSIQRLRVEPNMGYQVLYGVAP